MGTKRLRIGTRGSTLARWQTEWVRKQLSETVSGLEVSVEVIKTTGDRILDSPLSKIGGKGLFTKEIEQALLDDRIDAAVHSLKDLPTQLPGGLRIGAVTEREDVRDVFIPHSSTSLKTLSAQPEGAKIATGSLRRRAQVLHRWKTLEIVDFRGNLETRFKKLEESSWAGMILAAAGVIRLGHESRIGEFLESDTLLPAVGQGAIAVEIRDGDEETSRFVREINDRAAQIATTAERALLSTLQGGCQVPIGALGRIEDDGLLHLDAVVVSLDGIHCVRGAADGDPEKPEDVGNSLGERLLREGASEILESIRRETEGTDARE